MGTVHSNVCLRFRKYPSTSELVPASAEKNIDQHTSNVKSKLTDQSSSNVEESIADQPSANFKAKLTSQPSSDIKSKNTDRPISMRSSFIVYYLGWKEAQGVHGKQFTDPVVRDLTNERSHDSVNLNRLILEFSGKFIKIQQEIGKDDKNRMEKVKFSPIPTSDIAYTCQGERLQNDLVAVIILGFNPQTEKVVHTHVYRCENSNEARLLVDHLRSIIQEPENRKRLEAIERDLVSKGLIRASGLLNAIRPNIPVAYIGDNDSSRALSVLEQSGQEVGMKPKDPKLNNALNCITAEFKSKMIGLSRTQSLLNPVIYSHKKIATNSANDNVIEESPNSRSPLNSSFNSNSLMLPLKKCDNSDSDYDTVSDRFRSRQSTSFGAGHRVKRTFDPVNE